MKLILLWGLVVICCSFVKAKVKSSDPPHFSGKCDEFKFGETEAINCIMNVIDGNVAGTPGKGDKKVTPDEINKAKKDYLYWYERGVAYIAGGSTPTIMRNCAGNDKDPITSKSFKNNREKCLPTQNSLCQLKEMCDRAALVLNKPVY